MNDKLIEKLSDKWSQPEGMPAKGYEMVKGEGSLNPCAQSEAVMLSKGMGVMDFEAFLKGSLAKNDSLGLNLNLDKVTAKTLGISTIHSILLRRFNDLSTQSPAVVLKEPERVLGKNWSKVLEFWYFVDSLPQKYWEELLEKLPGEIKPKEYELKKKDLKALTETLDVITPDLYYLMGHSEPLNPNQVRKVTEGFIIHPPYEQHKPKCVPDDIDNSGSVTVLGDYSRAYFGWIAPHDYFYSNFPSSSPGVNRRTLPILLACATNEIQTLRDGISYEDLYFCKILGYNPLKNSTLRKLRRRLKECKQSLLEVLARFYRVVDNTIFSRFSQDEEVRRSPTKEMIEGELKLTEGDIMGGEAYDKIVKTYNVGKGRFFGSLTIRVPKLGPSTEVDGRFYQLVEKLKQDFDVWPLSFCDKDDPKSEEGSEWAISSLKEKTNPRVNVPKGYNSR